MWKTKYKGSRIVTLDKDATILNVNGKYYLRVFRNITQDEVNMLLQENRK